MSDYSPPYTITVDILSQVAAISEKIGRLEALDEAALSPSLRRSQRLRSIQSSLAIENNTLTLEQVTAVLAGKRVLGPAKEIHEVHNAFAAYEALPTWQPSRKKDLLTAHQLLMAGLIDNAGRYRSKSVGIAKGNKVVHLAPPAENVTGLMNDLLGWLKRTNVHPLISSSVFHYELEFIHPFNDGNGRMGRLWQTLILSQWKPLLAFLPVESVICQRQGEYYAALGRSDKSGQATEFIAFLLSALSQALDEVATAQQSDQVADQESDQVKSLLTALGNDTLSALELMTKLQLSHRPTFRKNYLNPALAAGLIERTIPDKPNSRAQKYRRKTGDVPEFVKTRSDWLR